MNLSRLYRRVAHKPLKVYWWRYEYPTKLNFGDEITPLLIERLFSLKCEWAEPKDCELIGAGSIIQIVQQLAGDNHVKVWGSGFIQPGDPNDKPNLQFYAVRGKSSRERTGKPDIALGDPGLLTSLVYPLKATKRYKLGIIPHYVDADAPEVKRLAAFKDCKVINPLDPVETVVNDIQACELIVSSSMHGLILSDSYNIPNHWTPFSDKLTGGDYKFNDYYSVFGLTAQPIDPADITEATLPKLREQYQPRPGLAEVQAGLLKAFPY